MTALHSSHVAAKRHSFTQEINGECDKGAFSDDVFLRHQFPICITAPAYPPPSAALPSFLMPLHFHYHFYHSSLFLQTFPNIHLPLAPGSFQKFCKKMFSSYYSPVNTSVSQKGEKETRETCPIFLKFGLLKLRLGAKREITIKTILQYF